MKKHLWWLTPKDGTRFKKAVVLSLVASLLLQTAAAAEVSIISRFPANRGPGYRKPYPDAAGAVGPRHTAVLDDRAFVVQDKATGKILQNDTQHDFWLKVLPARTFDLHANDPRLLYDPITERWIAWVQGLAPANGYLAVSTTSDPTGPWRGVKMPFPPHNYGARIGFDKNGLYISVHNGKSDLKKAQTCHAIPMADVVAAGGPDLSLMQAFPDLEIEAFPATDLDRKKAPDAPAVLLHREFGNSAGKLYMYKITWSGKKASISTAQSIPLTKTYQSPNGLSRKFQALQPAPGLKLRADEGRRTLSVFAHGGSVFGCNAAKRTLDSRCGILWYEVRVSDGALLQEGFVDAPDCDYLAPALAVDSKATSAWAAPEPRRIFIDANCLVYAATSDPAYGPACQRLLEEIEHKTLQGCTSAQVLGDLSHRLMTVEAALLTGRPMTGIANWLRRHAAEVQRLAQYREAVDDLLAVPLPILPVTGAQVSRALDYSRLYGLLTSDAVIVAVMQAHGLAHLASNDADFDRVPGISRYAPA